jgi:hypothetical protein
LQFVKEIADSLSPSSGFYVELAKGTPGLEVGYRFARDIMQLAAFTIQNLSFSIAMILPFDNGPARFRFALAQARKPFLISAGIYGGGGFVAMTAVADKLEMIEASFEYGAVLGFQFGPAVGSGRITAGIYIMIGPEPVIAGFFNASGNVTVANLIRASASLRVTLAKRNSEMQGDAEYTFSISMGFTDISISVTVEYVKSGKEDMTKKAERKEPAQRATLDRTKERMLLAAIAPDTRVDGEAPGYVQRVAAPRAPRRLPRGCARGDSQHMLFEDHESEQSARDQLEGSLAATDVWRRYWQAFEPAQCA